MSAEQTPSIGRVVHYTSYGTPVRSDGTQAFTAQCRAAIIAKVYTESNPPQDSECVSGSEWVALVVFNPTDQFFHDCCHDETTKAGGTWHWPERTE